MLQVLDSEAVRRWCSSGRAALAAARVEIDDLNVYPVPDGDTGTNLLLTMESVEQAVERAFLEQPDRGGPDLARVVDAMTRGAVLGARGNSGVIVSQLLRGIGEALADGDGPASSGRLVDGLQRASQLAHEAVAAPVEGTVLTVARECASAVATLGATDLPTLVCAARRAAAESLARTPELLPQLRAAGVVDAGGRGWCVLLEALERVVTGSAVSEPHSVTVLVPRDRSGLAAARESGSDRYAYEVQYLLRDASDGAVAQLRTRLAGLGDSLVVVGNDGLHNVHVHVNDVGAAVEAALDAGRPFRITVTRFADQLDEGPLPVMNEQPGGRAVVAVAAGDGLGALFRGAGAVVVPGGPTSSPSTAELLDAVRQAGAREVVLLPNDGNISGVASAAAAAARDEGRSVAVVPTRSVLQGLAALAVHDQTRPFADDVAAMAGAAGSTRWAQVTTAVREAVTWAGICQPGDVLGLLEGDVVLIGNDVEAVARTLVDRMLDGGGELVTVVAGEQAPPGTAQRLVQHVQRTRPAVEVVAYEGGQPHYPLLLGVE